MTIETERVERRAYPWPVGAPRRGESTEKQAIRDELAAEAARRSAARAAQAARFAKLEARERVPLPYNVIGHAQIPGSRPRQGLRELLALAARLGYVFVAKSDGNLEFLTPAGRTNSQEWPSLLQAAKPLLWGALSGSPVMCPRNCKSHHGKPVEAHDLDVFGRPGCQQYFEGQP